jgi:4'-phosphopantetheinyl transferase
LATERGNGARLAPEIGGRHTQWLPVADAWALPGDHVHVWRTSLDRPREDVGHLRGLLGAGERARADRFRFEIHRSRYIVGRGVLRVLLGRYLGVAPADVRFAYGAYDKPYLTSPEPWFNVSHSDATALYAFTNAAEVGIDVELDDADFARERIAERFFSPAEVAVLRSLPESEQARAFLTCWTRKEAFIKARGDGLSLPLDSFDVTLGPAAPAALLRAAWSSEEPGRWCLQDLSDRSAGYIAALAIRSKGVRVVQGQISELDNIEGLAAEQEDK